MKTRIFQLHKRSSYVFSSIQDKICFDNQKQIYAISDGATQGYKSEIWSEKLVKSFVDKPNFEVNSLLQNFKVYAESFQKIPSTENSNPALRALEERKRIQGGFATFMGVKIEGDELEYISSGDVCGFVKNNEDLQGFPFSKVEDLDQDKGFLGTQKIINGENKAEQFKHAKISLKKGDNVILMTDAIARLALRDKSILDRILSFRNYEDFFQFIIKEWEDKRLEEDDITIGIIEFSDDRAEEIYLPPVDFSFPKEEKSIIQFDQLNIEKMSLEEVKKHIQALDKKVQSLEEENETLYNKVNQCKSFTKRGAFGNLIIIIILLSAYHYFCNRDVKKDVKDEKTSKIEVSEKPQKEKIAELEENTEEKESVSQKNSSEEDVNKANDKMVSSQKITTDEVKAEKNTYAEKVSKEKEEGLKPVMPTKDNSEKLQTKDNAKKD